MPSKAMKIIVAEDEEYLRKSLVNKINRMNESVKIVGIAEDGKEALDLIYEFQPHLIITDIRMPVMDGLELIKQTDLLFPHIYKVITTGYAEFEYARQAIHYHVSEYLLKPVKFHVLKDTILKIMLSVEKDQQAYEVIMSEMYNAEANTEEIVQTVINFMQEHYSEKLVFNDIAKSLNFNSSYLSRIFSKHTGETPTKFLAMLRINKAKHVLMQHPELPVGEVGALVGYPDPYYFSRLFKQMTQLTPSEFKAKYTE